MDIVIDPQQYDQQEIEDGVADFLELMAEAVESGYDPGELIVVIGIALRMMVEEYGDHRKLH